MEYKTVSLADQVFERLEADILGGKYQRGETITELRLCAELSGVTTLPLQIASADPAVIEAKINKVANQGKAK